MKAIVICQLCRSDTIVLPHLVDFLILSLAASKATNSALPSMTRFSLADRTSLCQEGEGTDSGLRQRFSHNRSIAASLSDVVILSSGRTNSMCVSFLRMLYIKRLPHPSRNCNPSHPVTSNFNIEGLKARFVFVHYCMRKRKIKGPLGQGYTLELLSNV